MRKTGSMKCRGVLNKKQGAILLAVILFARICTGCGNSSVDHREPEERENESQEQEYVLSAKHAQISGQGINIEGKAMDTAFSDEVKQIVNIGTGSAIIYTVPEQAEGRFDIYLDISKVFFPYGSTIVSIAVNDGDPTVMPVALKGCSKEDYSDIYDMEAFLMKENESLKEGDTITIAGLPGYEMEVGESKTSLMPAAIGDLYLYSAGANDEENVEQEADQEDPLSGMNIAWLGSSVTYGMASGGYSMANAIEYIIAYVAETWNCPIVFYTGTYFESEEYSQMVTLLKQIQEKWDIGIIDQWDNPDMKALYGTDQYREYMSDDVHPTYKGYTEWWTPVFEEYLSEYMTQ